jgi:uncharacterized membrane protein
MADFFSNLVSGVGNALSGLTGGSNVSSTEGMGQAGAGIVRKIQEMEQAKKDMDKAQAGTQAAKPAQDTTMKKGGSVSSASSRADGIAQRGKTRGTMIMCGGGMARGKK